jgi:hypothetical protein
MGCGCKKKKNLNRPKPRAARVVVVEGQVKEVPQRKPDVINPPPRPDDNVENVVNKLNDILKS